jgi:hypothetical protein
VHYSPAQAGCADNPVTSTPHYVPRGPGSNIHHPSSRTDGPAFPEDNFAPIDLFDPTWIQFPDNSFSELAGRGVELPGDTGLGTDPFLDLS